MTNTITQGQYETTTKTTRLKTKSEAWKVGRIANVVDVLIVLKSWIFTSRWPAIEKTGNVGFKWSLFHLYSSTISDREPE